MKNEMLYIENNSMDPYFNIALEYYLATEKRFEDKIVMLLWRTSPTLMIGKYQNLEDEINKEYAKYKGINVVRRLSGGGTIYTDVGGWEYSFIAPKRILGTDIEENSQLIINALKKMGINAQFGGRNDLLIGNKKISGMSQCTIEDFNIFHGTLLYYTQLDEMMWSIQRSSPVNKETYNTFITNISEYLPKPLGIEGFKNAVLNAITKENYAEYKLTVGDISRIRQIAKQKISSPNIISEKRIKSNIVKKKLFEGGTIEIRLEVEKKKIKNAAIYGDFIGTLDTQAIEKALSGCTYERDAIMEVLEKLNLHTDIYKIDTSDIIDFIGQI